MKRNTKDHEVTYRHDTATVQVRPRWMGGYRVRMAENDRVIIVRTWQDGADRIECYKLDENGIEIYGGDLRTIRDGPDKVAFALLYAAGARHV